MSQKSRTLTRPERSEVHSPREQPRLNPRASHKSAPNQIPRRLLSKTMEVMGERILALPHSTQLQGRDANARSAARRPSSMAGPAR